MNRHLLPLALVVAASSAAFAEPAVLAIDGEDIYVDLGLGDGIAPGAQLELLHVVVARDPVSGTTLRDTFALGMLTVDRAGAHLAITRAEPSLKGRVVIGDRVRAIDAGAPIADAWEERAAASQRRSPPAAVAARAGAADLATTVHTAWLGTLGLPLEERIARWQAFLTAHGDTPYQQAIRSELQSLVAQRAARDAALATHRSKESRGGRGKALAQRLVGDDAALLVTAAPAKSLPGRPIALSFLVTDPDRLRAAYLLVRAPGQTTFQRLELSHDGDAYLRATIPAAQVVEPRLDWFVEVVEPGGQTHTPLGDAGAPVTIAIAPEVEEPAIAAHRTSITLRGDYVDFDGGLTSGHDQYAQAELDFTYRFLTPVHAFRLGFGTLTGTGGPKDVIDGDPTGQCLDGAGDYRCRRLTFSYVYAEVEYRVRPTLSLMIRPVGGILTSDRRADGSDRRCFGSDVTDCEFARGFGIRGRVRLGEEDSTNLVLGAGIVGHVGTLLEARYHWWPTPRVPVILAVEVTDQPVLEDFGVRLVTDVGWRGVSWFYPSLRVSYQARDLDHAGFSGGLALNFDW